MNDALTNEIKWLAADLNDPYGFDAESLKIIARMTGVTIEKVEQVLEVELEQAYNDVMDNELFYRDTVN